MKTALQTAAGILLAGAVGGVVWLGVEYPAAFLRIRELGATIVFVLLFFAGVFGVPVFLANVAMLFREIHYGQNVPEYVKTYSRAVGKSFNALVVIALISLALWAYVEVIEIISEAVNPEFYR